MENLSVEDFISRHLSKYDGAMKALAHQPECEYRITVYERNDDYIAILDNNRAVWESGRDINSAIDMLKRRFPELSTEYGVKYIPMNKQYYNLSIGVGN